MKKQNYIPRIRILLGLDMNVIDFIEIIKNCVNSQ